MMLRKPLPLQAMRHVGQHRLEGLLLEADRARARHVTARGIDVALRDQLDNRSAKGVPEPACDRIAVGTEHVVVLACREPGAVGLHAARRDDDRRLAVVQSVSDVHPRHLLHPHRVRRGERIRRVEAVVYVRRAVTAAHAPRITLRTLLRLGGRGSEKHCSKGQGCSLWSSPSVQASCPDYE